MVQKRYGTVFLLGAGICQYFANKVSRKKDYDIEKKNLIIETLNRWMTLRDNGISLESYLKESHCKKAAIYGLGMIGNHLYEELRHSEIEIVGIDRKDIYNNFQMPIYKPDEYVEGIDLIIITPFEYKEVCRGLHQNYQTKVISFQQLLSNCEEYLYGIHGNDIIGDSDL